MRFRVRFCEGPPGRPGMPGPPTCRSHARGSRSTRHAPIKPNRKRARGPARRPPRKGPGPNGRYTDRTVARARPGSAESRPAPSRPARSSPWVYLGCGPLYETNPWGEPAGKELRTGQPDTWEGRCGLRFGFRGPFRVGPEGPSLLPAVPMRAGSVLLGTHP